MGHRAKHLPVQLSVGERQRVAIARALANEAPIAVGRRADRQPRFALRARSARSVRSAAHERGMTLVVITHSREVAERAERIVRIRDGRLSEEPVNSHRRIANELYE